MATEFSLGCAEKCKSFLEKSVAARFEKSSQLVDFLREAEDDLLGVAEAVLREDLLRLRAAVFRKIDLSAWIRSIWSAASEPDEAEDSFRAEETRQTFMKLL